MYNVHVHVYMYTHSGRWTIEIYTIICTLHPLYSLLNQKTPLSHVPHAAVMRYRYRCALHTLHHRAHYYTHTAAVWRQALTKLERLAYLLLTLARLYIILASFGLQERRCSTMKTERLGRHIMRTKSIIVAVDTTKTYQT